MGTLHANYAARSAVPSGIDDHHGRLHPAAADHPRDDRRLHRRRHPGRAPARRFAPDHPDHRSDGPRGRVIITQDILLYEIHGEDKDGRSSAAPAPASAAPASGSAPAISAWRRNWRRRWTKRRTRKWTQPPRRRARVRRHRRRRLRLCRPQPAGEASKRVKAVASGAKRSDRRKQAVDASRARSASRPRKKR